MMSVQLQHSSHTWLLKASKVQVLYSVSKTAATSYVSVLWTPEHRINTFLALMFGARISDQPLKYDKALSMPVSLETHNHAVSAINMYCVLRQLYCLHKHRALKQSGINSVHYSGHGFRIGTATTAAACGPEDSLIQTLGWWKSTAYLRYITQPCRVYHWCVLLPWALLLLCALTWKHTLKFACDLVFSFNCQWFLCSNLYLIATSVILIIWTTSPTVRDVLIINTPSTFRASTVLSLQTFFYTLTSKKFHACTHQYSPVPSLVMVS